MTNRTLALDLPEEIIDLLGSPDAAVAKAREALVFALLREARISQGKAAQLLGLSRWEILDLLPSQQIATGAETAEELRQEVEAARSYLRGTQDRGRNQR